MRMRKAIAILSALCAAAILAISLRGYTQEGSALQNAAAIVKPQAYISLEPIPRGQAFQVAVIAEIRNGYHINANKPADEFLIPTTLTAQLPSGLRELETVYPPQQSLKLSFSQTPLLVYTGRAPIFLRLQAGSDAPLGAMTIPLVLRYQPCNDTTCLPPVKIPIPVTVQIAAAGASTHNLHPEIFNRKKP
ncbi:MAG: protein-disulfide reductase DsbD domain-containing protein [Candidatus Acidiferrales bacterium]